MDLFNKLETKLLESRPQRVFGHPLLFKIKYTDLNHLNKVIVTNIKINKDVQTEWFNNYVVCSFLFALKNNGIKKIIIINNENTNKYIKYFTDNVERYKHDEVTDNVVVYLSNLKKDFKLF